MDFFRSVFTEDPDPPSPESKPESTSHSDPNSPTQSSPAGEEAGGSTGFGGWGFGGLVKSLATRSESVIETYRRDLQEFGTGLKKETLTLKEVASRAVKDLPSSVEISASKAQGAFHSIAEIVAHGKETLLASDLDSDLSNHVGSGSSLSAQSAGSGRYSRFEAQLQAIQCDANTYAVEPEDVDDYRNWKLGFDFGGKGEEIEDLLGENGAIGEIYKRLVPNNVDHEAFWCRYFYRVQRLQQAESVRANLVKRAISKEDEEELSWDVDDEDEDEDEEEEVKAKGSGLVNEDVSSEVSGLSLKEASSETANQVLSSVNADEKEESSHIVVDEKNVDVVEPIEPKELSEAASEVKGSGSVKEPDEEVAAEVRTEVNESGKDSDVSMVSNQPPPEEDDLGWDEIEDLGSDDEKKVDHPGVSSSSRAELRKRLSAAGDDEDLNWDIEDDDEPIES